jgi:glycosyltransferase involved in cell wall biosynthesis
MLLSIITSSFNGATYLPRCLESVLREASHAPALQVEHVVVDAASTDGSVGLLEEWKRVTEERKTKNKEQGTTRPVESEAFSTGENKELLNYSFRWMSEPDRGQSDGFNKGVQMATGDWICWLNSDDEIAPDAFEMFFQALKKQPGADLIYGHVQFIDEASQPIKTAYTFPYHHWLIRKNVWLPPSSGTYFRKQLLIDQPLDPDYHYVMDVEWFLRAGKDLRGVLVDRVMSRFRVSTQGKTSAMISTGAITDRHHMERERYRQKYIYSQWPGLDAQAAKARLEKQRKLAMLAYYALKLPHAHRYLLDRFGKPPKS